MMNIKLYIPILCCLILLACSSDDKKAKEPTLVIEKKPVNLLESKQDFDRMMLKGYRNYTDEQKKLAEKMKPSIEQGKITDEDSIHYTYDVLGEIEQAYQYNEKFLEVYQLPNQYLRRCMLQERLNYPALKIQDCYKELKQKYDAQYLPLLKSSSQMGDEAKLVYLSYFLLRYKTGETSIKSYAEKTYNDLSDEIKDDLKPDFMKKNFPF